MKIATHKLLNVLHVLAWICFLAVCFEAGSFLFNMIYSVGFQPLAADYLHLEDLLAFSKSSFCFLMTVMAATAALKALALYQIIKIFVDKKIDLKMPFNKDFGGFLFSLSYFTFATGIVSYIGAKFAAWITEQNIVIPDLETLRLAGADVWIFMSATFYVIALIFKRGVEMQQESELTI